MPAWPLALATLPAGFAVAELTGSRPVGGLVLIAGGLATVAASDAPMSRKAAWGGVALVCFVVSHLLADPLGAWVSVGVVAGVTGVAGRALLEPHPAVEPARSVA